MKKANHNTIQITCLLAVFLLILFACKKEEEIIFEGTTCMNADRTYCDDTQYDEIPARVELAKRIPGGEYKKELTIKPKN